MSKYALVKNGLVISVFNSDLGPDAFPDIAANLHVIDESVSDNWTYDGVSFSPPVAADACDTVVSALLKTLVNSSVITEEQKNLILEN